MALYFIQENKNSTFYSRTMWAKHKTDTFATDYNDDRLGRSTPIAYYKTRKPLLEVASTALSTFFLLWPWTLTYDLNLQHDVHSVKVNQHAKYPMSRSKVNYFKSYHLYIRHNVTDPTNCSSYTTKVVAANEEISLF